MIVITEFMDEAAVDALRRTETIHYDPGLADRQDEIPALVPEAGALIVRNRTRVSAELLDAAPHLKCVGRLGVGLDNIDLEACAARGVTVYPATGANNLSVAEYVVTAALVLLRQSWFLNAAMLDGSWPRAQAGAGKEIAGKTLGLIGFGAIARDLAGLARGLGMQVAAHDPFVPVDDPAWSGAARLGMDEVLGQADVISLHVPLTSETRHAIDRQAISRMKAGAILINAARGGVVDEAAVADALREGQLGGAALDTFDAEPLTRETAERFRDVPNLILTPHIAGVTTEANGRVSKLTVENVLRHLAENA